MKLVFYMTMVLCIVSMQGMKETAVPPLLFQVPSLKELTALALNRLCQTDQSFVSQCSMLPDDLRRYVEGVGLLAQYRAVSSYREFKPASRVDTDKHFSRINEHGNLYFGSYRYLGPITGKVEYAISREDRGSIQNFISKPHCNDSHNSVIILARSKRGTSFTPASFKTWNIRTGAFISEVDVPFIEQKHLYYCDLDYSCPSLSKLGAHAWHPEGLFLAACLLQRETHSIDIFSTKSGKITQTLTGHTRRIIALSWNAKGTVLAAGQEDNNITLWNTHTGESLRKISFPFDRVLPSLLKICWHPREPFLAALIRNTVVIWNADRGVVLRRLALSLASSGYGKLVKWNTLGTVLTVRGRKELSTIFYKESTDKEVKAQCAALSWEDLKKLNPDMTSL